MTTDPSPAPWDDFTQDPRLPQAAPLRASDRDRDVVLGVLGEGYAEGRLDKAEYDDRSQTTGTAKTLGELVPLIDDLVPHTAPTPRGVLLSRDALTARALSHWEDQRRRAMMGFLLPTLICWVIWLASSMPQRGDWDLSFPWPLFVTLGTAVHVIRVQLNRQSIIAEEQARLEKKQLKALEKRRTQEH